jgi:ATP-dependent DNA helicase RecQ
MEVILQQQIYQKLKEVFGYDSFREEQEKIIHNILAGKNTFVIMPTGGGKSLCYQIPALIQEGVAIIISPLIALMKDQVDQLQNLDIQASFLNSTLSQKSVNTLKQALLAGQQKLLYIAPETLTKEDILAFLQQIKISFVAVDEAHCISDWGHDFRPEYRNIKNVVEHLGKVPIIALTATATPKVQVDILKNLAITDATIFKSSFNRTNLYYKISLKEQQPEKQLIRTIKDQKQPTGIVYCQSRKQVEAIASLLQINDIKAAPYHAGLESSTRIKNQDAFLKQEVDVIVATIAFGMGIDKPDVRFVIHYDVPKSLEGYYQETGRAGRDGLESLCLTLYSPDDILKLERLNKTKSGEEREKAKCLLEEVKAYILSGVCRRKQLLHYFGEAYPSYCGYCDNCTNPTGQYPGKKYLELLLSAIQETNQRFNTEYIIKVIRGEIDDYITSYQHQNLVIFGKGKEEDYIFWLLVIRQALLAGFIEKNTQQGDMLQLTQSGKAFLQNPHEVDLVKDNFYVTNEKQKSKPSMATEKAYDTTLLHLLTKLREKVAKEKAIPPYAVIQDSSLEEMTLVYPTTLEELAHISGLSMSKAIKFGTPFITVIKKYVEDNGIIADTDIVVKSKATRSKDKIYIIQQIDRKTSLEEIATTKSQTIEELLEEIEQICYSGLKLNLNYYIDTVLTKEQQAELYDYFMQAKEDNIKQAYKILGNRYDTEEIRLMRIKFLSDVAN